jgi:hypothetical protein
MIYHSIDTPLGPNIIYIAEHEFTRFITSLFTLWDKYRWDPDPAKRKIEIVQFDPSVSQNMMDKPSVVIKYTNVGAQSVPMGIPLDIDEVYGELSQAVFILQTVLYCNAPNDIEAETIASYIMRGMHAFKRVLLKHSTISMVSKQLQMHMSYDDAAALPGFLPKEWYTSTLTFILRVDDIVTYADVSEYTQRLRTFEAKLEEALSQDN